MLVPGALLLIVASCASRPAPAAHPLDLQATCPTAYLPLDEATCEEIRPPGYGLSASRPLMWGGAGGGPLWFGRLKCADGQEPRILQLPRGEPGPSAGAPLSAVAHLRGESDILDVWSVSCGEQLQTWYVDVYHCGNPCPPEGAALIDAKAFSLFQSSLMLAQRGQSAGAVGAARRATELDPGAEGLWSWRGTLELAAGRYDDALVSLERAAAFDPTDTDIQLQRGAAMFESERYPEYLELLVGLLEEMPANDPRVPELYCRRGLALTAMEELDEGQLWIARSCAMGFRPCCEVYR